MSGLGISEFEDTMWDDFFRVDDHMVPHDGLECSNIQFPRHDSLRYSLCKGNCNSNNPQSGSVSQYENLGGEQSGCSILQDRCSAMSESDSWSRNRSVLFPFTSETDLIEETSSVAFDDNRSSFRVYKINDTDFKGGEFPVNDTYLGDRSTPVDLLSDLSHEGSSFSSLENIDSTDFFSDVLADMQSFDDVEWMLRSPDSAFDIGVNREDANISEEKDSSKSYLVNDFSMPSSPIKFKDSSHTLEKSDSVIHDVDGPAMADSKDGIVLRDEAAVLNGTLHPRISTTSLSKTNSGGVIQERKNQFKPLNQRKGIRKGHHSGKGGHRYCSNLPIKVAQLPSVATSHEDFPPAHLQWQQKHALDLQNYMSNAPLNESYLPDQTSVNQSPSAVKCEGTDLTFLSQMEFSKESSPLQIIESSDDLPSPVTSVAGIEKRESQQSNQGKQFEDPIDADGVSLLNPGELCSSIVQERSTLSVDDISPEAASFCQLQLVTEWLDFRTRLCIRDGLYRLAQGAKQRPTNANPCGNSGGGKTSSGLLKCTNFTNMETGTNPIDRSIAHLLFHRPSDICGNF